MCVQICRLFHRSGAVAAKLDRVSFLIMFLACVRAAVYMTSEILQVCECEGAQTDRNELM